MNDDRIPTPPEDDPSLPARLRDDLAGLFPSVSIPASIDSDILSRAKSEYARRARFRPVIRWATVAAAMAAVVAIVAIVRIAFFHPTQPLVRDHRDHHNEPSARLLTGDINGDGKVDMLDAYILARRLAEGTKPDPAWDANGDGVVDQRDVDWIVNASVSVGTGDGTSGGVSR